jgi:FkbM family methyltransferase
VNRFRLLLLLGGLLGAAGAAYALSSHFRLAVLVVAGHSQVCPFAQAVDAEAHEKQLMQAKDRYLHASHKISEENGLELWDTPKGNFWIPQGNKFVLPFNLAEMEQHIYGTGAHFVQPGDIVLDCGASDGDFTREALRAGARLVVSIEVSPPAIECLRRNLAEPIAQGRVIVYPKGVWDQDSTLTLNLSDSNFAANSVVLQPKGSHRGVQVPLTTIDKIVSELKLAKVDFIKMDVEGAELKALAGAAGTIKQFKPRMSIATEHKEDDEVTIPKAVRGLRGDYRMSCGPCEAAGWYVRPSVLYFD